MKKDSAEIVEETNASEAHALLQVQGEGNASKKDWDELVEETKAIDEHTPSQGQGLSAESASKEQEKDVKKDTDEILEETKAIEEHTSLQGQGLSESASKEQETDVKEVPNEIVEEIKAIEEHTPSQGQSSSPESTTKEQETDVKEVADEIVEETKAIEHTPSQGQSLSPESATKEQEKDVKEVADEIVEEIKAIEEHTPSQGQSSSPESTTKEQETDVKEVANEIVEETKSIEEHMLSQGKGLSPESATKEQETDVKEVADEIVEEIKAIEEHTPSQGQGLSESASKEKEQDVKEVADEIVEKTKAVEEPASKEQEKGVEKDVDEIVEETKAGDVHSTSKGRGLSPESASIQSKREKHRASEKKLQHLITEETKAIEERNPSQGQGETNGASKEKEKDVKKDTNEIVEETNAIEKHTLSQGLGLDNTASMEKERNTKKDSDEIVEETKAIDEHTPLQGQGQGNTASKEKERDVKKNSDEIVKEQPGMVGKTVPPTNEENEREDSEQQENESLANDQDDHVDDEITPESDLSDLNRRIWVVTTASLPWRTGTAVNPLARALYLTRGRPKHYVGLVIPWLESQEDQAKIYGSDSTFETQQDQETWIRNYAKDRVHCEKEAENLKILFYSAVYHDLFGSIFATEDICSLIPDEEADVAILEEPEHLNWFRVPPHIEDDVDDSTRESLELGWTAKFKHVVGILHTNYSAYMQQYGIGTSFIAASALGALSSVVVRAHCHRLIRLSATLPELNAPKEVTCNVHGVRLEFLEPPKPAEADAEDDFQPVPIYFIGKIIWAKGFDNVLSVQEMFKDATGDYFPMDVYGSGGDEKAIKRAFLGRKGITSTASDISENELNAREMAGTKSQKIAQDISPVDMNAALVFGVNGSLRGQIDASENIEILMKDTIVQQQQAQQQAAADADLTQTYPNPLEILGDLSGKTLTTGGATTSAIGKLVDNLVQLGFHISFSKETHEDVEKATSKDKNEKEGFHFDPPKSRFELRRHAIPARFLGTKDHAFLRAMVGHKIFLNMSETEVLCTTTAEALAMGKFVIIPKHPSNTFFEQFANCLVYESKMACVDSVKWALENDPEPLSEKEHFMLTWEGANERLYKSSTLTKKEVDEWNESGTTKADRQCARLHMDTLKRGHFIQKFLTGMH